MAIEKNGFKVARFGNHEYYSPRSKDRDIVMSSDDDDIQRRTPISAELDNNEDDDDFEDCDSGAGSDDIDLLELGETGDEFCQVGDQTCSIPYELYDLSGLRDVLSMEVWNEVLTEEDRFGLAKYLPDMDQEDFVCTLKEIFFGDNLHFGNPVDQLFDMLKGGLCEPRVALYRQGSNFLQRRRHYHNLRKHHNGMVTNVCQIRDAWMNCKGYSIQEKLRVLNIMKSQNILMNENKEDSWSESSDKQESGDVLWGKKPKDQKLGQKYSAYGLGAASDISSPGWKANMESAKHRKQNPMGNLKFAGAKTTPMEVVADHFPSSHHGAGMKSGRYNLGPPLSRYNNLMGHDSSVGMRLSEQMKKEIGDEEDTMYEVAVHRDQNYSRVGEQEKPGASKFGKAILGGTFQVPTLSGDDVVKVRPSTQPDQKVVMRKKGIKVGNSYTFGDEYVPFNISNPANMTQRQRQLIDDKKKHEGPRGVQDLNSFARIPTSGRNDIHALGKNKIINQLSDINILTSRPSHVRNIYDGTEKVKFSENLRQFTSVKDMKVGKGQNLAGMGHRMFDKSEDTESNSSEQMDEDNEDDNPLMRSKWAYPGGVPDLKYGPDTNKTKLSMKVKKDSFRTLDGSLHSSLMLEGNCDSLEMMKANQKGKMHVGYSNNFPSTDLDKIYHPGPGIVNGNEGYKIINLLGRNGHADGDHGEIFEMASRKSRHVMERRLKGEDRRDFSSPQPQYVPDYNFEDGLFRTRSPDADNGVPLKLGKNSQMGEQATPGKSGAPFIECKALSKKRKIKDDTTYLDMQDNNDYFHADALLQLDDMSTLIKRGKNSVGDAPGAIVNEITEPTILEHEMEDVEAETKPQKKSFPLITPSVHTNFSFSIIHLLSAVRVAMITLLPGDSSEVGKPLDLNDSEQGVKKENLDNQQQDNNVVNSMSTMEVNTSLPSCQPNVPSLNVQDIVNRVKSNPGDPCILETQEPLQDLVRGVLKTFSSRTAPLGVKGWKPLVVYEKLTKGWSWIGPVSNNDCEVVEEVTSPDAWGLPYKMLVKLVDSFANWLKNSQDTLQQIGSLPVPPLILMQSYLDEKERFKDLRAQKSLSTITQSSEEVRTYFRKEEVLRYLIPDRAFSYTAIDGKKSIVAPLRRCGGKPTSKARDHFMLKRDRPPHVTILCLVRDAAARLPGSIGTRADVCTLIRDSQYIMEDVSDAQVNQVVSGALDRLHYERDPCVQFDGERKLWVYLHREREEEDFEDDGTSSTKKWRRPKKEATEPSDHADVTVAYAGPIEQQEFDLVSDLNVEASCAETDKGFEPDYPKSKDNVENNTETSHGSDQSNPPVIWNSLIE